MRPDVTVVVCTYNRSQSLRRTLARLAEQRVDGFEYEVIVVDNNSRDDTRQAVTESQVAFGGRLRYLFESRQGQSYARNAGVGQARGEVVAFTDDDVEPEETWLSRLHATFSRFEADCVFGKVLPQWDAEPPPWLGPYFQHRLAMVDRGSETRVVTSARDQFVGANFAVRLVVLEHLGGFNIALGNRGDRLSGEEDTELFERLLTLGVRIVYTPEAVVHHHVQRERMSKRYFRRWHFEHGVAAAHVAAYAGGRHLFGIPLWAIRDFLSNLRAFTGGVIRSDQDRRLIAQMRLVYDLGLFAGCLGLVGTGVL